MKNAEACITRSHQEGKAAEDLENRLRHLVIGHDEAIQQIVRVYQTDLAGLSPVGRPIGNFLFLAPTGSGKGRIIEATAESLLKDSRSVIKVDCAEFQHSHEIAKLIESPPGYLGHRETHPLLSQETLNQHHTETVKLSFVLFDEIEKASEAVWNLLLGILDKATLTLGDNHKIDFSAALIFLTSNLGASEMTSLLSPQLGFRVSSSADVGSNAKFSARISGTGIAAACRKFTPEFINRLDKIVVVKSLGVKELRRIVDIELETVQQRIQTAAASKPFQVNVTDSAREFLLVEGTDFRYGARHVKRAIERLLVQPLSNLMAGGQIHHGDCIRVSHEDGSDALMFGREPETARVCGLWQVARHKGVGKHSLDWHGRCQG
jgi:ATP-dependent Clp protease ATP-binding subunit ClpB